MSNILMRIKRYASKRDAFRIYIDQFGWREVSCRKIQEANL